VLGIVSMLVAVPSAACGGGRRLLVRNVLLSTALTSSVLWLRQCTIAPRAGRQETRHR
jgi:hypothetical protein